MYTYVPWNGLAYSPFGYSYWSPFTVSRFYSYAPYYWGGSGYVGSRNLGGITGATQTATTALTAPAFSHGLTGAAHAHSSAPSFDRGIGGGMGAGRISGGDSGYSSGAAGRHSRR